MNRKDILRAMTLTISVMLLLCGPALADLAKGDRGDDVTAVQRKLIDMGYLNDVADGIFGKNTQNAVIAYQQAMGLPPTGIVDDATLNLLNGVAPEAPQAPLSDPVTEPPVEPQLPAPEENADDAPINVPVFSSEGDVFASLKLMDGCGWVSDEESESYSLGRNAAGEEVVYGISLVNDGAPDAMALEAVSWTDNVPSDSTDMLACWTDAKAGLTSARVSRHTEISSDGNVYPVASVDVFLPDDPAIAGEQSVTVSLAGHTAVVRVLLTYDGGYVDGNGWKLEKLGVNIDGGAE